MFETEVVGFLLYALGLSMLGVAGITAVMSHMFVATMPILVLYMLPAGLSITFLGVVILFVSMFSL